MPINTVLFRNSLSFSLFLSISFPLNLLFSFYLIYCIPFCAIPLPFLILYLSIYLSLYYFLPLYLFASCLPSIFLPPPFLDIETTVFLLCFFHSIPSFIRSWLPAEGHLPMRKSEIPSSVHFYTKSVDFRFHKEYLSNWFLAFKSYLSAFISQILQWLHF